MSRPFENSLEFAKQQDAADACIISVAVFTFLK
jgi:hypothetical protein